MDAKTEKIQTKVKCTCQYAQKKDDEKNKESKKQYKEDN